MKYTEFSNLDEVKMSPTSLAKFAQGEGSGMMAGFEAELIFPEIGAVSRDSEEDMGYNETANSIDEIIEFFNEGNDTNELRRLKRNLNNDFKEWLGETPLIRPDFDEHAEENIFTWITDSDYFSEKIPEQKAKALAKEEAKKGKGLYYDRALSWFVDQWLKNNITDDEREEFEDEWLRDVGLHYMSDVYNEYTITWPYWTEAEEAEGGFSSEGAREMASSLSKATGWKTRVYDYHGASRPENTWVFEPDPSIEADGYNGDMGVEIVSPPQPLNTCLENMKTFFDWAKSEGAYSNESTGFHMSVSLPDQESEKIDFVKLALFLGDKHVLEEFDRLGNSFCQSALKKIKSKIGEEIDMPQVFSFMRDRLMSLASKSIVDGMGFDSKYTTINPKNNYIEFRSAGGEDYFENIEKIQRTLMRYAQALKIAEDPQAHREEYAKKFYKLLAGVKTKEVVDPVTGKRRVEVKGSTDDAMLYFARYIANQITAEELKQEIARASERRKQTKTPYWYQVDFVGYIWTQNDADRMRDAIEDYGSRVVPAHNKEDAIKRAKRTWGGTYTGGLDHYDDSGFVTRPIKPYVEGEPKPRTTHEHALMSKIRDVESEQNSDKEGDSTPPWKYSVPRLSQD